MRAPEPEETVVRGWVGRGYDARPWPLFDPRLTSSDNLLVASTFKDILSGITTPLRDKLTLRLECEVVGIRNILEGQVEVKTADGFVAHPRHLNRRPKPWIWKSGQCLHQVPGCILERYR